MRRHKSDQTTCSRCAQNPKRRGGRWCHPCHAADQADRRERQRRELEGLRAAVRLLRTGGALPALDNTRVPA
jgi:hypothetical protein